jgi:ABC-2 type transport system permease protein
MRTIWIIANKELGSFFDSLIAYILLTLFLGFSGFFTWMYGNDIFLVGQTTLRGFFNIAYWSLFFLFQRSLCVCWLKKERQVLLNCY